jgi:hypothetical protein
LEAGLGVLGVVDLDADQPGEGRQSRRPALREFVTREAVHIVGGRICNGGVLRVVRLHDHPAGQQAAPGPTRHLFDLGWRLKRAVAVGLTVGVLVLFACQFSHTVASLLAGVGTGATAAVVHLGVWARRTTRELVRSVLA